MCYCTYVSHQMVSSVRRGTRLRIGILLSPTLFTSVSLTFLKSHFYNLKERRKELRLKQTLFLLLFLLFRFPSSTMGVATVLASLGGGEKMKPVRPCDALCAAPGHRQSSGSALILIIIEKGPECPSDLCAEYSSGSWLAAQVQGRPWVSSMTVSGAKFVQVHFVGWADCRAPAAEQRPYHPAWS